METTTKTMFRMQSQSEAQGAACPFIPAEERRRAPLWKQVTTFFFRFGVCPMCMTASVSYSLYELMRFRRIRPEHSVWSVASEISKA
jgi:hypothetical protein